MKHVIQKPKRQIFSLALATTLGTFLPMSLLAVDLDSPAAPNDIGSAMFTLQAICDRLNSGTAGAKRGATFSEPPSVGPFAGVGCTLDEAMAAAPAGDNTNGASINEVWFGKTFWSLRTDGTWGLQTGTLAHQIPIDTTVNQPAGNYSAFDLSIVDTDLVTGNIRNGVTIFGIAGDANIVDTSTGDAVAADIATGKKAWVAGVEVTGTATGGSIAVIQTGQTTCYDAFGSTISCASTGQDGDKLAGATWPNPRFTDNSDGTITDKLTGLIWLKNANCFGLRNWTTALSDANSLSSGSCGLTDGSVAGDWRLPNYKELFSLIDAEYDNPALSNSAGTMKWTEGDAFSGVQTYFYWSSTTVVSNPNLAWFVATDNGGMNSTVKTLTAYVWPVRGGVINR